MAAPHGELVLERAEHDELPSESRAAKTAENAEQPATIPQRSKGGAMWRLPSSHQFQHHNMVAKDSQWQDTTDTGADKISGPCYSVVRKRRSRAETIADAEGETREDFTLGALSLRTARYARRWQEPLLVLDAGFLRERVGLETRDTIPIFGITELHG